MLKYEVGVISFRGDVLSGSLCSSLPDVVQFGNGFLGKLEGSIVDAPILKNITLVDTPGERRDASVKPSAATV